MRTSKTALDGKAPAAKPEDLSLISGTHIVEGELTPENYPLTSTYNKIFGHSHRHTHTT